MAFDIRNLKSKKGQVTVEFMLLLVIMLVYITTVIQPSVNSSSKAMNDIKLLGETDFALQRIASQINYVNASAQGTTKTISLYVPAKAQISCANNSANISFLVNLEIPSFNCSEEKTAPETACNKSIATDARINCSNFSLNGETKGKLVNIQIVKLNSGEVSLEVK